MLLVLSHAGEPSDRGLKMYRAVTGLQNSKPRPSRRSEGKRVPSSCRPLGPDEQLGTDATRHRGESTLDF